MSANPLPVRRENCRSDLSWKYSPTRTFLPRWRERGKKSAREKAGGQQCPGRWPCGQYAGGWSLGSCSGAIGARGPSSPHLFCSNACLNSLGGDSRSSSTARSEDSFSSCGAPSQGHGSPGSSKCGSHTSLAQLPTSGSILGFLASGWASNSAGTPFCKAAFFLGGRPGMGRGRTFPVSRLCFR